MLKKGDLVNMLANRGYTKGDARTALNDIITAITEALVDGEDVQIHGFGTFSVKQMSERESIDYQSKERIVVPGHKIVKFLPSIYLRRVVKEGIIRE